MQRQSMGSHLHSSVITAGFKFSGVQRPFENVASWEMRSCKSSTAHLYKLNYLQNLGTDNCSYTNSLREPGLAWLSFLGSRFCLFWVEKRGNGTGGEKHFL